MKDILKMLPSDLPLSEKPYEEIAEKMSITEDELIETLEWLRKDGIIRRIAAILYHRKAFYTQNAMVVWNIEEFNVEKVGRIMASFSEVSHCYERDRGGYWNYNVYTMIHGRSVEECNDIVRRISEKTGINDYRMFFSKREFKKTALTMHYE